MAVELARPADHEVRERALDPTRSFIVQAPAGSGKTELLTRRFLRLLATVDAPEEILAITFTRKAAAEMRNRILGALTLGRAESPPDDPHLHAIWRLARVALRADTAREWRLADYPSRLRIQTIDALNQSLARRLPVAAGVGAPLAIAADPQSLYAEVVLRIIERLAGTGPESDAIARLVTHLDNDIGAFERLLADLLARREHWLDVGLLTLDAAALRPVLEGALAGAVRRELEDLVGMFPAAAGPALAVIAAAAGRQLIADGRAGAVRECATLTSLPGTTVADLPAWTGIATLLLRKSGEWRSTKGINAALGCPPAATERKAALASLIGSLSREAGLATRLHVVRHLPPTRYPEPQWHIIEALLIVLRIALAELELMFAGRGEGDYPAAAIAARRALGSPDAPTDLALRLDLRLRHILVDEFQDTSRGQVELLRLLTAGWTRDDGRTLFLVGDPMQSIYHFREADVRLFLELRRAGLGEIALEPLALSVNFRSHRPIVDWANGAFAALLPARDDVATGAVAYTASAPRPDADSTGSVRLHALAGPTAVARAVEAARVADIARRAWAADPQASIAVLVTSRTHLPGILTQLRSSGLPVRAVEIDPLATRPVVEDLIALTRALVHVGDRTAWLAVLRGPCCGLGLAALHALCADAPDQAICDLVGDRARRHRLDPADQLRLARVASVLELALAERGRHRLREWVERTWNALGGPAALQTPTAIADADVYFGRLEEIERAGDLADVARLESLLGSLYGSATPDCDAVAIEVMTVHKAKGLEFDVVILPGLDRTPRGDDAPLLRWAEDVHADGRTSLLVGLMAQHGADRDPIHAWLGERERARTGHERARLLYVAATRAIGELHLIGNVAPRLRGGVEAAGKPSQASLLGMLWRTVAAQFAATTEHLHDRSAGGPEAGRGDGTLVRLSLEWSRPPADPPLLPRGLQEVIEGQSLRPEFDWVTETSRHTGTVVHREIERSIRARSGIAGDQDRATDQLRYLAQLAELGVPPSHREAAADTVQRALTNMADDERGRWLLAGEDVHLESETEVALSGFVGDELVNGVIDRSFVDTTGTRWIVDFKTSSHTGGGLEQFLASEEQRYRPQLERYARLVRAWRPGERVRAALYFPLLRAWREVPL
jgi:ATP-dependent helicase/nuclease subunit A